MMMEAFWTFSFFFTGTIISIAIGWALRELWDWFALGR